MVRQVFPITKKEAERQGVPYSSERNREAVFPTILRKLREEAGVSQAELAAILGVSKSTLGLYETGDTLPDAKTLRAMAVFFGVSADYLLHLSPTKSTDVDIQGICKKLNLKESAVRPLLELCGDPDTGFALMLFLETAEFKEIIAGIQSYLSIHWKKRQDVTMDDVVKLDEKVRTATGGNYRVVPASLEKAMILMNLQKTLADAVEEIDQKTLPPEETSGGRVWR